MTINPLVILTEKTSQISENISPAKAAYILSQILEKVGYDEQLFENSVEEVNPSEQNDAISALSEIICKVNSGKSYEESIVTALSLAEEDIQEIDEQSTFLLEAEDRETSPSTQPAFVDEVDNSSELTGDVIEEISNLTEQKETSTKLHQQYTEDIHRYVIPLVLKRLIQDGSDVESKNDEGLNTRLYESEHFTATLKFAHKGKQSLTLDRKTPLENEEARVLEATRESSQLRFEIIINYLTQEELEKIKVIALQEKNQALQIDFQQREVDY